MRREAKEREEKEREKWKKNAKVQIEEFKQWWYKKFSKQLKIRKRR